MKIRELRNKKNWSQTELAEKANTSQNLISRYENGTIKPNARMMERLAKAFGIKVSELFE